MPTSAHSSADLGKCPNCGAQYLRAEVCPALCGPPPAPPPKYRGPRLIGRSHMSKLAAPVYNPEDPNWIG